MRVASNLKLCYYEPDGTEIPTGLFFEGKPNTKKSANNKKEMNIHWKIPFKSLRSGIVYTLNIYDPNFPHTSSPMILNGGAEPFVTEEDNNDDLFCDVRTQSGYLRIVDNGQDADGNSFDWHDLVPTTDTDRPIKLTHVENNSTVIDWQGFMQAQNFGGVLYGNPQEREYPIQCALTVLEGTDIDTTNKTIENFAFVLRECVNEIDRLSGGTISNHVCVSAGDIHIDEIWVQGGVDARRWLLKRVDWQNFLTQVDDEYEAKYNLYEVLEDICKFWGWTARTCGTRLYLCRPEQYDLNPEVAETPMFAVLTRAQLDALANGTDASSSASFSTLTLNGSEFATIDNDDYRQRGNNKSLVKVNANGAELNVIEFDEKLVELMEDQGISSEIYVEDGKQIRYSNDLLSFTRPLVVGTAVQDKASFNLGQVSSADAQPTDVMKMIRIKTAYNYATYATLTTVYHHVYAGGYIVLRGETWRRTKKFEQEDHEGHPMGEYTMQIKLGVGRTRGTAVWYDSESRTWGNLESEAKFNIGNSDSYFYAKATSGEAFYAVPAPNAEGLLFIEFMGSTDIPELDGERSFELVDFHVEYYKANIRSGALNLPEKVDLPTEMEYTSRNQNNVRSEWSTDCIYASDNDMGYGYGLLINPDGTFMETAVYGADNEHPEQNLADRVTTYWQVARRKVTAELLSNIANVAAITPQKKVKLDIMVFYPLAITREWRDDITRVTLLELPQNIT